MSGLMCILSMNPIEEENLSRLLDLAFWTRTLDIFEGEQSVDLQRGRNMIAAEIRRRRALLAQCPVFKSGDSVQVSQIVLDWPYAGNRQAPAIGTRGKVVAFPNMPAFPACRAWQAAISRRHYAIVKFGPRFGYAPKSIIPIPRWCLRHVTEGASA